MEAACFFCSDFEESRPMQRMALFFDLARKRLLAEIVTERHRTGMHMVVGSGGGGTEAGTRDWLP